MPTQLVRDVMTTSVVGLAASATLVDAARDMRVFDIGDVLVVDGDQVTGIITDRDIVIRAIAVDRDPAQTTVGEVATQNPIVVSPD